jgi:peptide/nickel transport system ATP-binding protein
MATNLLEVRNLSQHIKLSDAWFSKARYLYAVDDVSFTLNAGETLGLVGESGCGKSTLARTLLKLLEPSAGHIIYQGQDITGYSAKQMMPLRKEIQIIFQDPMDSLNARHTIGAILQEPFEIHQIGNVAQRCIWAEELLAKVGLPQDTIDKYPHELSGGQKQRVGIARAIALKPKIIVCDEAVSALDMSVQAQIMNLLLSLQQEMQLALIFIAHDLSVVKHISDKVAVMYLGKIVELTSAQRLYETPLHPYSQALISAIPIADPRKRKSRAVLHGDVPSAMNLPVGCYFASRCTKVLPHCLQHKPILKRVLDTEHLIACHLID